MSASIDTLTTKIAFNNSTRSVFKATINKILHLMIMKEENRHSEFKDFMASLEFRSASVFYSILSKHNISVNDAIASRFGNAIITLDDVSKMQNLLNEKIRNCINKSAKNNKEELSLFLQIVDKMKIVLDDIMTTDNKSTSLSSECKSDKETKEPICDKETKEPICYKETKRSIQNSTAENDDIKTLKSKRDELIIEINKLGEQCEELEEKQNELEEQCDELEDIIDITEECNELKKQLEMKLDKKLVNALSAVFGFKVTEEQLNAMKLLLSTSDCEKRILDTDLKTKKNKKIKEAKDSKSNNKEEKARLREKIEKKAEKKRLLSYEELEKVMKKERLDNKEGKKIYETKPRKSKLQSDCGDDDPEWKSCSCWKCYVKRKDTIHKFFSKREIADDGDNSNDSDDDTDSSK